MANALIGYSGFVGKTLLKDAKFDYLYKSTTIHEIQGRCFDSVYCAAAPAQKWIANLNPESDKQNIEKLIDNLKTIQCKKFILISTVDVFKNPISVNEATAIDEEGLHAYGLHRYLLEKFVNQFFSSHLIVRLPGLVGPGLKKNIIFDFLHNNNLHLIESRNIFQFYPMVNLWRDLQIALQSGLSLLHLTAEPIEVSDIAQRGFGKYFHNLTTNKLVRYDMQTKHAQIFGAKGRYQYCKQETIQAIRDYVKFEKIGLE